MQHAVSTLAARLAPSGLDLVHPLAVGWYNEAVPAPLHLPGAPDRLAVVVGNTRGLWGRFLAAFRNRDDLREAAHPLDRYVEEALTRCLEGRPDLVDVRYAHEPPPRRVAIQRAAHVAGLAWLSPAHLSVHEEFGPWIALRAVVVLDLRGPGGGPREPRPCGHGCEGHCLPALQRAIEAGWDPASTWPVWVAVRDACPRGRQHRYSEDALRYHYAKDRSVLG